MSFSDSLSDRIRSEKVIAVIVIDDPESALPLADALREGGIRSVELTLRTPGALEALRKMKAHAPELLIGAGTVLTPGQAAEAQDAGADFAVSPGCNPRVLQAADELGLPFAPGIMTPTDIETALEFNCRILKFFPAATSGGIPHLTNIAAPYKHLGVGFIPLGGINIGNLATHLACPLVIAVGGSWLATRELLASKDWSGIRENAVAARRIADAAGKPA